MFRKKTNQISDLVKITLWVTKLVYRIIPQIVIALVVFETLNSIIPFIRSRLFSRLIDNLVSIRTTSNSSLVNIIIMVVVIQIISSFAIYIQNFLFSILDIKLNKDLRKLFLKKISSLDLQYFEDRNTSNLIAKVREDYVWRIREVLSNSFSMFSQLVSFGSILIILFPSYWYLALLIFLSEIPRYFFDKKWQKKEWKYFNDNIENTRIGWDINWQLTEKRYLSELRINNAVHHLFGRFSHIFDDFAQGRLDFRKKQAPSQLFITALSNLVLALSLLILIGDLRTDLLTIGLFTFYFDSIRQAGGLFSGILNQLLNISEHSLHINNFKKLIELPNLLPHHQLTSGLESIPTIEFKNVWFKYPNSKRYIYKNLNLTINPAQEIALVGINGAGKSTLIKLLCRFYDPQKGQILANGIDIKLFDLDYWYSQISVLFQEFTTYPNLTLKENVTIGNKLASDSNVKASLIKSEAISFTNKYSKGLNTMMSQRYGGEEPSWGQWQKIAIARIFHRDSPVLILDEPTASIDATSEYNIFNRLYHSVNGKTIIIVSHRFSTVRNAQKIIVIDKGRIVEQGNHEQLIKLNGLYSQSFKLQAQGYT